MFSSRGRLLNSDAGIIDHLMPALLSEEDFLALSAALAAGSPTVLCGLAVMRGPDEPAAAHLREKRDGLCLARRAARSPVGSTLSEFHGELGHAVSTLALVGGIGALIVLDRPSPTILGFLFGAIAGVMVFLTLDEQLPAAKRHATGHETTWGLVGGMALLAFSLVLLR